MTDQKRAGALVQMIWLGVGGIGAGVLVAVRYDVVIGVVLILVFVGLVAATYGRLRRL